MVKNLKFAIPVITMIALFAFISPPQASARVHFGVYLGAPPVTPYPYAYAYPYPGYPYAYSYPYSYYGGVYGYPSYSWSWGHRGHEWRGHEYRHSEHGFRGGHGVRAHHR